MGAAVWAFCVGLERWDNVILNIISLCLLYDLTIEHSLLFPENSQGKYISYLNI